MMNRVAKMIMGTMMIASLLTTSVHGEERATEQSYIGNNILKSGVVVDIEYSKNPDSMYWEEATDLMYFEVEGHIYEVRDFAEDMFVDDDVLVCFDTKGTESVEDDVVMMLRYWRPDLPKENSNKENSNNDSEIQEHLYDVMHSLKGIVNKLAERD